MTNGLGINISAHTKHAQAAGLLWVWLTNQYTEKIMSMDGYIWGSMQPLLDEQHGRTVLDAEAPNYGGGSTAKETELDLLFGNKVPLTVYTAVKEAKCGF